MSEQPVRKNKYVEFTYQITDETGEIIEQVNRPVGYVYGGAHQLFDKVESALEGLKPGEKISVELPPGEAYGQHDPNLTFTDELSNVPPQFHQIGAQIEMQNENGETKMFVVTAIDVTSLTMDGNHPMADMKVIFNLTVISVRDATPEEINGKIHTPDMTNQQLH